MRHVLLVLLLAACGSDTYYQQLYTQHCRLLEECEGEAPFGSVAACRDYYVSGAREGSGNESCRFEADKARQCLAYHRGLSCSTFEDASDWDEDQDACTQVWTCD